jgi:hypothetical protein
LTIVIDFDLTDAGNEMLAAARRPALSKRMDIPVPGSLPGYSARELNLALRAWSCASHIRSVRSIMLRCRFAISTPA